jgi:kynurenine formamidase
MPKYIDLSLTFDGKFGKFDKKFNIDFKKDRTYEQVGRQASSFTMSSHGHTHLDAPLHMAGPDTKTITDYPVDYFIGEASLINVPRGKNEPITGADLEAAGKHCRNDDIVIIRTGWVEKMFGKEEFIDSPYLTDDAAEWLVRLKARIVGYDFVHDYNARVFVRGGTVKTEDCTIHLILLRNGVLNLEFLNNLSKIEVPRFQIFALPIKLKDADGAPCRPVAVV